MNRGIMILVSSFKIQKEELMPLYYMKQTFERIFVVYFHSINSILAIKEKGRERAYSRRNSTEYEKPEMQSI